MSYGTASASSDPSLRRRNDYFSPAEGSFSDMSYPPYSELPFTSRKRRKQSTSFVKWTMRAVLASPIVVLVVYSTFAVLFSSKQVANTNYTNSINKQRRKTQNKQQPPEQQQQQYYNNVYNPSSPMMQMQGGGQQQPQYMMAQGGGQPLQLQQDTAQGNTMMMMAQNNNPQAMMMNTQQQQQQQTKPQVIMMNTAAAQEPQQLQHQRNMMPVPPSPSSPQAMIASMAAAEPQNQMMATPTQQQQQPVITPEQFLATHPNLRQAKMLPVIPPMGSAGEQAQPMGNAQVTQPMGFMAQQGEAPMGQVRIEPLQGSPPDDATANVTQPNPYGKEASIYYYYPQHAVDQYGNVKVPSIIFDRSGYPVDLKALQGKQVYMEPPKRGIAASPLPKWGESSTQDQNIIVSTVAVMALLVGALSARRMRSRSFLSACIENESLEDDVAYDTAYTTTDHSYNTFGGWKGDLEKFDV
jgi:hypothetical protein